MRERYLRTDWAPFVAGLGLSLVGAVLIWSATHEWAGTALAVRHLVNTVVGVVVGLAVVALDVRWLRAAAPWVYLAGLSGLVLVLTPVGQTVNGSRSWLFLPGGFSLQPAELAKIGLVVGLAMILAEGRDPYRRPGWREVIPAWVLAAVPIGLIMLQPDLGSGLVLGVLTLVVVATSGASWRWSAAAAAAVCAAVVAAIRVPLLDPYQVDRLLAFRDPGLDPEGIGYQTRQARLAIGSGGWSGTGLGEGPQTQGGFIPFQYTDFIFTVAGEELGFVGAVGLLVLLGFLVVRGLVVALRCEEPFGRLLAVGVSSWFGFQIFENVGMNLGLMPVTGLPLPFLSYGGSSMLACWVALGLLACASGRYRAARPSWRPRSNLPR
ncbi:rod shape-determining protein RodA [Serinicoccus chungangensis]|uniref:peptidoglycan glycosyltransferase n=1 Tax=Serinicoccus chungangensis TaxID=767452 RepID=A0A0W8I1F9_9MICO|nr:rod shape-determining protein RodA [Serinicoccus chungangensis]KUG51542.1 rod shape-determining protein RodA [Serinicoccus chungangensis]